MVAGTIESHLEALSARLGVYPNSNHNCSDRLSPTINLNRMIFDRADMGTDKPCNEGRRIEKKVSLLCTSSLKTVTDKYNTQSVLDIYNTQPVLKDQCVVICVTITSRSHVCSCGYVRAALLAAA